jgi:hypothetical protein
MLAGNNVRPRSLENSDFFYGDVAEVFSAWWNVGSDCSMFCSTKMLLHSKTHYSRNFNCTWFTEYNFLFCAKMLFNKVLEEAFQPCTVALLLPAF